MSKKIDRTGEVGYNNQGEKITIIRYGNNLDIDVQFEDGVVVYNRKYKDFIRGKMKHPIKYEQSFAHHIEVELGLNLDDIWNWEKNNENNINPYEVAKQSSKKVWLYCQENDYHNYDMQGNKIGYEVICSSFYRGSRCSYCGNHKVHYKDSLAYIFPQIAKMIAIPENDLTFEDCFDISCRSGKRFYFKCLDCGIISDKPLSLNQITNQGYSCKKCGDGISIPNKFAHSLLTQLKVNFQSEYSPYYFRNTQRSDFLLKDLNIILEMDGNYGNHTKEYDIWRDFLNFKYGGYKTIRIDLTDNNRYKKDLFNYIKEQIINSELSNIFDLSKVNWELIWEQCQKSKCVKAWELWNNEKTVTCIMQELMINDRGTIIKYLKIGNQCGKCNYTVEESIKIRNKKNSGKNNGKAKKVICTTTDEVFDTMKEGAERYGMKSTGEISNCCKGYRIKKGKKIEVKSAGKLSNGTPLVWMYYEDYLKLNDMDDNKIA